ncbi:MAG: flippase [Patescibacteria group bacterium]
MTLIRKLALNTGIQLGGKLVSLVFGLGVVALMTRALGQEGFGQYTTIIAFLQLSGIMVDLGLTVTTGKTIAQNIYSEGKLLGNILSFRTITSLVAFSLAPVVALMFPYPPIIKIGIALTSLSFFATSLAQTFGAVFQKYLRTGLFVSAELAGRVMLLIFTAYLAWTSGPLLAFILAIVVANLLNMLLVFIFVKRLTRFYWEIDFSVWKYIWRETWPVALTIALNLVYFKTDTIILSVYRPLSEVGIYGASYKVLEILLALPTIIGGLLLPLVTMLLVQGSIERVRRYYIGSLDIMLAAGLALIAASLVVGREAMTWLAGSDFAVAGEVLKVVSVATALIFFGNLIGYFILAFGKQKQMIKYYAVAALISLIGYFIFIPQYSYWGAAWVTVVIEAFMAMASIWILRKQVLPSFARWPKLILAAVFLGLFLYMASPWPFMAKVVAGLIVYPVLLYIFKAIPADILLSLKTAKPDS